MQVDPLHEIEKSKDFVGSLPLLFLCKTLTLIIRESQFADECKLGIISPVPLPFPSNRGMIDA